MQKGARDPHQTEERDGAGWASERTGGALGVTPSLPCAWREPHRGGRGGLVGDTRPKCVNSAFAPHPPAPSSLHHALLPPAPPAAARSRRLHSTCFRRCALLSCTIMQRWEGAWRTWSLRHSRSQCREHIPQAQHMGIFPREVAHRSGQVRNGKNNSYLQFT